MTSLLSTFKDLLLILFLSLARKKPLSLVFMFRFGFPHLFLLGTVFFLLSVLYPFDELISVRICKRWFAFWRRWLHFDLWATNRTAVNTCALLTQCGVFRLVWEQRKLCGFRVKRTVFAGFWGALIKIVDFLM